MSKPDISVYLVIIPNSGSMFFVAESTDPNFYAIVRPILGDNNDIQIDRNFYGHGKIRKEDVGVVATISVASEDVILSKEIKGEDIGITLSK